MEPLPEGLSTHPKEEELFKHIDHVLSEETLIIEGLNKGIQSGWLTEAEKSEWLSAYIDKRNSE